MRIAFISYEYPPDTALGGIGTYVLNAARMMRDRGHEVEVFCGTAAVGTECVQEGILVHRIVSHDRGAFPSAAGQAFATRHGRRPFDVLEGPEFGAEAASACRLAPDVPFVIRLHTPSFLARELNRARHSVSARLRSQAVDCWHRARRRGPLADPDVERQHVIRADGICSPSLALADIVAREWRIERTRIRHLPNPFLPAPDLLTVPPADGARVVTFVGRLELRKGVVDLVDAIPRVLAQVPDARLRFVGRDDLASPRDGLDMRAYLCARLGSRQRQVEFLGQLPGEALATQFASSAACVFPSRWENFPYVCLEAMAAGRAIVASAAGGMAEILDGGRAGLLVPPRSPAALAEALVSLLSDARMARSLGAAARERVLAEYSPQRIGEPQERFYREAIERRRGSGARP